MSEETNEELLTRYKTVKLQYDSTIKSMNRCKLGSRMRTKKASWAGCLNFVLIGLKEKIKERSLDIPDEEVK